MGILCTLFLCNLLLLLCLSLSLSLRLLIDEDSQLAEGSTCVHRQHTR